jgi:hypothetical protein
MSNSPFPMLQNEQFISLTTYRKNGTPVATPVWFAEENGRLFVMTLHDSGKAKRLRHTPTVEIAPCDARGTIHGDRMNARAILHAAETDAARHANNVLNRKYGLMKRMFDTMQMLRGAKRVYLEVTPA